MENQVLTTTQAAKLLGISVRTAQLLIESGTLKSWKTPGGHRRVYHADVLAYMAQSGHSAEIASALAILLVSTERRSMYDALLRTARECTIEVYSDVLTTTFAIGSHLPAAVIVDMHDDHAKRLAFLRQMAAHPELGRTQFIAVGDKAAAKKQELAQGSGMIFTTPAQLPSALRAVFAPAIKRAGLAESAPTFPIAANERQRLAAVERAGLVNTPPEAAFDHLTRLASRSLRAPVSLMTMLTETHQWFKSRVGLELTETPRSWAFCNYTILQKELFAVPDLARTAPFSANPAVTGEPHFRFYAGTPVFDPDGFALGSLCVMDYEPRKLDSEQEQTLLALAALASDEVRLRATSRRLRWALSSGRRQ